MSSLETMQAPCRHLYYHKLESQINLPVNLIIIKLAWRYIDSTVQLPKIVTGTVELNEIINDYQQLSDSIKDYKPKTAQLLLHTPEEATVELEFKVTPIYIPEANSRLLIIDNLQFILEANDQSDSST